MELEQRVLDGLRDILLDRDDLLEEFAIAFKAEVIQLHRRHRQGEDAQRKELAKVERGIERCLALITDEDGEPGAVRGKPAELVSRKRALSSELRNSSNEFEVEIHPNTADLCPRKLEDLRNLLTDDDTQPKTMEIIRSMVDRFEVSADETRGKPQVLLVGALASILEFATMPKRRTPP